MARRAGGLRLRLPARRLVLPWARVMGMETSEMAPSTDPTLQRPGGGEDESEEEVDMRLYCICRQLLTIDLCSGVKSAFGVCS